jgi:L-threonylcarbamoyladenylate synthase
MSLTTEILPTHTPALFDAAVAKATMLLKAGEVVALPTETVYGLAANALNPRAVQRIFEIKGRPAHNPIIVHVASLEMARRCVSAWPEAAGKLATAFWPGPLTLVLPRARDISDVVTAGGSTVGIRWPSHPFIQGVIRACEFPLAAPSANPSSATSPTTADHVHRILSNKIPLIVDGGQSIVGIESTVIDVTALPLRLLRPGMIHRESIAAACPGFGIETKPLTDPTLRSPGLLEKHYSPKARLAVFSWSDEAELEAQLSKHRVGTHRCHVIAHTRIPLRCAPGMVSVIPHDPQAFARALYAELHRCDEAGAETIIVEAVPNSPEWDGIRDRLARASR